MRTTTSAVENLDMAIQAEQDERLWNFNEQRTRMIEPKRLILCIKVEPEITRLIQLILEHQGFQVVTEPGWSQGLETVRQTRPELVIFGQTVLDQSDAEAYERLKTDEELKDIPTLGIFPKQPKYRKYIPPYGKLGGLVYPFGPQELVSAVYNALGIHKRSPFSTVLERIRKFRRED